MTTTSGRLLAPPKGISVPLLGSWEREGDRGLCEWVSFHQNSLSACYVPGMALAFANSQSGRKTGQGVGGEMIPQANSVIDHANQGSEHLLCALQTFGSCGLADS